MSQETREEFEAKVRRMDAAVEKFYGVPQPWLLPTDEFYALLASKENEALAEHGQ